MKYVLFLMMILFSGQAVALDCSKQPTCAELGYSTEENPNCFSDGYLICPFDSNYKKCVNFNCESLGFTQSDKSDWCADIATCKGDKSYTLCQTPCIAWDSDTLSSLASSGKCKVVTMKNDITIPENQDITLAENTTLDGNGHTITATLTSFTLLDGAKLKNMHINRKISSTKWLALISVPEKGFFEDLSVLDENNNTNKTDEARHICWISGSLTLSGALKFEVKNDRNHRVFSAASGSNPSLILENANLETITTPKSSEAFVDIQGVAKNSEIHIKTVPDESYAIGAYRDNTFELFDSKMIIETVYSVCWKNAKECTFKLGPGGYFDTKENSLLAGSAKMRIIFNGTAENPATLVIAKEHQANDVTLEVQNTAAKFNYMGITYRPKQIGTTLLSQVPSSPNWEKVP